jgi:hypothetical protein
MRRITARWLAGLAALRPAPSRAATPAVLTILLVLAGFCSTTARAGVYEDDLAKCFVGAITDSDRTTLAGWMFSNLALDPTVHAMSTVTAQQRQTADKNVAALFSRLLADNCHKQALDALKYEGVPNVIPASFRALTELAIRYIASERPVLQGLEGVNPYLRADAKLHALVTEATPRTPSPGSQ